MELPPDTGDTFLREVDENLRRDQLSGMARKYGGWLIGGVILLLATAGGWLYWQDRQKSGAAADSEVLAQVYTDIGAGKLDNVPQRLDALATGRTGAVGVIGPTRMPYSRAINAVETLSRAINRMVSRNDI